MKKLIVTVKSSSQTLSEFKNALKAARKGRLKEDHFEISFDNKKDFDRFAKNLSVLSAILTHKPKSIYELAKLIDMDVSNLNKLIAFFVSVGAIRIKTSQESGRAVKTPIVEYGQVEFDLNAA
jgi:predicted transcriptional regulator